MAPGPRIAGLRRFAASAGMRVLAMLVMVALPLNGAWLAVSSIVSPAHYHVGEAQSAHVVLDGNATRVAPGSIDADMQAFEIPGGHEHRLAEHRDHHDHATDDGDHGTTLDHGHHQKQTARDSHHDGGIGHHRHGLQQTDVVYVEGDPERTDPVHAGKHVTGGEAALPVRSMAILPVPDALLLPCGIGLFVSLESEPPLRPPSARGSGQA